MSSFSRQYARCPLMSFWLYCRVAGSSPSRIHVDVANAIVNRPPTATWPYRAASCSPSVELMNLVCKLHVIVVDLAVCQVRQGPMSIVVVKIHGTISCWAQLFSSSEHTQGPELVEARETVCGIWLQLPSVY